LQSKRYALRYSETDRPAATSRDPALAPDDSLSSIRLRQGGRLGRAWTAQGDTLHAGTERIESFETLSNPIGSSQIEMAEASQAAVC
jgi:hypothetical protein